MSAERGAERPNFYRIAIEFSSQRSRARRFSRSLAASRAESRLNDRRVMADPEAFAKRDKLISLGIGTAELHRVQQTIHVFAMLLDRAA